MLNIKFLLSNNDENLIKLTEVFTLCVSQIRKCIIQLLDIFKLELHHSVLFQVCIF